MIDPEPWVSRPHRGPRGIALALGAEERSAIEEAIQRSYAVSCRQRIAPLDSYIVIVQTLRYLPNDAVCVFEQNDSFTNIEIPFHVTMHRPVS